MAFNSVAIMLCWGSWAKRVSGLVVLIREGVFCSFDAAAVNAAAAAKQAGPPQAAGGRETGRCQCSGKTLVAPSHSPANTIFRYISLDIWIMAGLS